MKHAATLQKETVREFLVDLNGSKLDIANGPLLRTQLQLYDKFYVREIPPKEAPPDLSANAGHERAREAER